MPSKKAKVVVEEIQKIEAPKEEQKPKSKSKAKVKTVAIKEELQEVKEEIKDEVVKEEVKTTKKKVKRIETSEVLVDTIKVEDEQKEVDEKVPKKKTTKRKTQDTLETSLQTTNFNSFSSFSTANNEEKVISPVVTVEKEEKREVVVAPPPTKKDEDRDTLVPENTIKSSNEKLNNVDFFLYYDLYNKTLDNKHNKLTDKEQEHLMKNLKILDLEGIKMTYLLIRMFSIKNNCGKVFDLPFEAKIVKDYNNLFDIEFDLKVFPNHLCHILLEFSIKHLEIASNDMYKSNNNPSIRSF